MGFEVTIPTIFIGREDGQKIVDYIHSIQKEDNPNNYPVVRVIFETNQAQKSYVNIRQVW
jgi:hypothetical protein